MYAFPRIELPEKAIEKAKSLNQHPDFFYAISLLETTGICIVPGKISNHQRWMMKWLITNFLFTWTGSGFGQLPGTYHFRTTILPPQEQMQDMMTRFTKFHTDFIEEFK